MQDKFKLASRGKFCMRSMRPFVDGETFYSLLVEGGAYAGLVSPQLVEMERLQAEAAAAAAAQQAAKEFAKEVAKAEAEGRPAPKPPKAPKPGKPGAEASSDEDGVAMSLLRRVDLGGEQMRDTDRTQAIVHWKTIFTATKSKKKRASFAIDTQGLIDLFLKLEDDIQATGGPTGEDDDPELRSRIQLRYVVALMLIRKRKLRLIEFRTDKPVPRAAAEVPAEAGKPGPKRRRKKATSLSKPEAPAPEPVGKEWMIVIQAAGTRRLKVRVIPITVKDRARLKEELSETLGLGDDVLGDATAAMPTADGAAVPAQTANDMSAEPQKSRKTLAMPTTAPGGEA